MMPSVPPKTGKENQPSPHPQQPPLGKSELYQCGVTPNLALEVIYSSSAYSSGRTLRHRTFYKSVFL